MFAVTPSVQHDEAVATHEVVGVVTDSGDVVVPSSEFEQRALVPGQRVRLRVQDSPPKRHDAYGVLAGKVRPLTREEIKEASREAWGDWIS